MFGYIPVEIKIIGKEAGNNLCKSGFARLTWSGKEDHALVYCEILPDFDVKVPALHADNYS